MSTHTIHNENYESYFCTVTCDKWLQLFELAQSYDVVYNWFSHLKQKQCMVLGYVIMPNHFHVLLYPTEGSLNKMVSNGKRFMAYDIVKRLKAAGNNELLKVLQESVQDRERKKGKLHQVFKLSFDARVCFDEQMLEQKLDYMHHNPVSGKWKLVDDYTEYLHSSAAYYDLNTANAYVSHYKEIGYGWDGIS